MHPQITSTYESKEDNDKDVDISRRHVNDPGKPTNFKAELRNGTLNPMPLLKTSTSLSNTTNLL